ncbi:Ni/Fe hydrogenase subunit alpha [Thiovibrio frasassiensis]|uniref:Ni/Fe hydrogenase subunit alpha n=1 Tax=Thiovibrio frasassiensis TaxID=2984131 RepID=A0A9X4RMA8_9BACT|nr:Ni/Fe hydrogenase subunit alpha [Thiovibrio frasassiensis]MDG4475988.1 Ni/Fe hydrogenase subunit alpha [Thiovibrio frasassiensis]
MKLSCEVNVHHLTRVEGHGNIRISIKNGVVKKAQWEVVETPRFFEAMLVGKHWENAPYICGRICGICSIGHTLASIRAVENAFGITPSAQTTTLRLLLKHMETLQSHILHLYFLAAPDFLGTGSVLPLTKTHPQVVQQALRLKLLANDACDIIGGRRLHPTRTVVGGFTMLPEKAELETIRQRLLSSVSDLLASAELFKTFAIPDFSRETEFVSLKGETNYPFIGGALVSTDGVLKKEHQYRAMTNEYCKTGFTSKLSRLSRPSLAVGALARLNNNFPLLHPAAQEISISLGLEPVNHNPYMGNVAQLVECVHVVLDSVHLIDTLLGTPWQEPRQPVHAKKGEGVGAVEVPRGILYHYYKFDSLGKVIKADCVIPTSQNHANILHDIEALASQYAKAGKKDREIELLAEMLVRAYDPCISCSVH